MRLIKHLKCSKLSKINLEANYNTNIVFIVTTNWINIFKVHSMYLNFIQYIQSSFYSIYIYVYLTRFYLNLNKCLWEYAFVFAFRCNCVAQHKTVLKTKLFKMHVSWILYICLCCVFVYLFTQDNYMSSYKHYIVLIHPLFHLFAYF